MLRIIKKIQNQIFDFMKLKLQIRTCSNLQETLKDIY